MHAIQLLFEYTPAVRQLNISTLLKETQEGNVLYIYIYIYKNIYIMYINYEHL